MIGIKITPMATVKNKKKKGLVNVFSNLLIFVSVLILVFIFYPVTKEEIKYQINKKISNEENLVPLNKDFTIVIPKISAVAPIIKNNIRLFFIILLL